MSRGKSATAERIPSIARGRPLETQLIVITPDLDRGSACSICKIALLQSLRQLKQPANSDPANVAFLRRIITQPSSMADQTKAITLVIGILLSIALLLVSIPPAEAYDGASLSQWGAATAWRMMGTEIVRPVATLCGDQQGSGGGISVYQAKWETNCNLVVYKDFVPAWSSNTHQFGYDVCYLSMQSDGNLIIYGEKGDQRTVIWSSSSTQSYEDDFYVSLTLNGNLGIFTSNHKNIWRAPDSSNPWP